VYVVACGLCPCVSRLLAARTRDERQRGCHQFGWRYEQRRFHCLGLGWCNDEFGRRNDEFGRRNDEFGRRNDEFGRRYDELGRHDDELGWRDQLRWCACLGRCDPDGWHDD
jgi:hypothetical protein